MKSYNIFDRIYFAVQRPLCCIGCIVSGLRKSALGEPHPEPVSSDFEYIMLAIVGIEHRVNCVCSRNKNYLILI